MRRRLDLAAALVINPPVLFLDEPTTGLDPQARADLWDIVNELVAGGTTLLLTTQYMEEADQFADRIAVVDNGRVIALGPADQLKDQVGGDRIELTVTDAADAETTRQALAWLAVGEMHTDANGRRVTVPVTQGTAALTDALGKLAAEGVTVHDAGLRRPTLDDVFLTLTGHEAHATANNNPVAVKEYSR